MAGVTDRSTHVAPDGIGETGTAEGMSELVERRDEGGEIAASRP